ncbi:MAG TPA: hypothetical protein VE267_09905 [Bradyrhizobium sp.]|nr:hypothetical protein [Bradyrhizobium sp.]
MIGWLPWLRAYRKGQILSELLWSSHKHGDGAERWRRNHRTVMPLDGDRTAPGLAVARWHPAPSIRVFEIKEALAVGGFWNCRT